MMEEGISDKVVDLLHKRREKFKEVLTQKYKRTKPFRAEPVPNDFQLKVYDNMNQEDVNYAIQTYGYDNVNQWMFSVEQVKQRRIKNAT